MDFRHIPLHAGLVVVTTRTDLAFHIESGTFLHPFFNEGNQITANDHIVPFRTFRNNRTIGQRITSLGSCKREVGNSSATIEVTYFWIASDVTDQYNFIQ